jgi:hypothetical protein
MALVIIAESPTLTAEQKTRIGGLIGEILVNEGITRAVVHFQPSLVADEDDITVLNGSGPSTLTIVETTEAPVKVVRRRSSNVDVEGLKEKLFNVLKVKGVLSSTEAAEALQLKSCTWAPATLRKLFGELEEEKLVTKTGKKRGTKYLLAIVNEPAVLA